MADIGHIENVIFFVSYTIFTCNTSNITNFGFGVQNSFLMLFSSLYIIFSLEGQEKRFV